MKLSLISLGCAKNTVDSEKIINIFSSYNIQFIYDPANAEGVLINTCGFIKSALNETNRVIQEMLDFKKENNNFKVVIFGCAVKRMASELKKNFPELDGIYSLGQEEKMIGNILARNISGSIIEKEKKHFYRNINITLPHYAYLKIAEGCNRKCAFCTIPDIRGRYTSRKIEDIVKEAKFLVKRGVKELILIAQDTTNYGKDLYKKPMLLDLLKEIEKIRNLPWIRILYAYPEGLSEDLMNHILKSKKILHYIDLPIQHSHPDILKKMGRTGSFQKYDHVFNYLRSHNPDFCLRTTVITGFPGEKKEHFIHLLNYINEKQFDRLGVFGYENEPGTKAYTHKNQVLNKTKQKRLNEIMLLQQEIHFNKNTDLIGKNLNVIIDQFLGKGQYVGRSYRDAPEIDANIYLYSKKSIQPGSVVNVKITSNMNYDLKGVLV